MIKHTFLFTTAMFASTAMLPASLNAGPASGRGLACYQWSLFSNSTRFVLDVKKHSPLSVTTAENEFGEARQTAYSVHGKTTGWCGVDTMSATTGTVVTGLPRPSTTGETGSHMGLEVHASRGDGVSGGVDSCRSGEFECSTSEASPTPSTWSCQSRNEFDVYHGDSTLTLVDMKTDSVCSFFEDGGFLSPSSAARGIGTSPSNYPGGPKQ